MRTTLFLLLSLSPLLMSAQELKPRFNVDRHGLWVEGYDPVAYLVQGRAVKGSASISAEHEGATFRFAIMAHRDLFLRDPDRFLPQYGGWCAYAMGARNEKVEVDPTTFRVKDGRVYLFYNAYFNNTLTAWSMNEAALRSAADRNWASFKHKP